MPASRVALPWLRTCLGYWLFRLTSKQGLQVVPSPRYRTLGTLHALPTRTTAVMQIEENLTFDLDVFALPGLVLLVSTSSAWFREALECRHQRRWYIACVIKRYFDSGTDCIHEMLFVAYIVTHHRKHTIIVQLHEA